MQGIFRPRRSGFKGLRVQSLRPAIYFRNIRILYKTFSAIAASPIIVLSAFKWKKTLGNHL